MCMHACMCVQVKPRRCSPPYFLRQLNTKSNTATLTAQLASRFPDLSSFSDTEVMGQVAMLT